MAKQNKQQPIQVLVERVTFNRESWHAEAKRLYKEKLAFDPEEWKRIEETKGILQPNQKFENVEFVYPGGEQKEAPPEE